MKILFIVPPNLRLAIVCVDLLCLCCFAHRRGQTNNNNATSCEVIKHLVTNKHFQHYSSSNATALIPCIYTFQSLVSSSSSHHHGSPVSYQLWHDSHTHWRNLGRTTWARRASISNWSNASLSGQQCDHRHILSEGIWYHACIDRAAVHM